MFYREWLAQSDLLFWPMLGLLIFFVAFVVVLVRLFTGRRGKNPFDAVASLPLADDDAPTGGDYPRGAA